jgi:hypothetical protein
MASRRTAALTASPALPRSKSSVEELVGQVEQAGAAAIAPGAVERSFLIAGRCIRLCFASDDLADRLTRAFTHLAAGDGHAPELTVVAWDSMSTGAPAPPLPDDADPAGPMWRRVLIDEPPVHVVFKPGPRSLSVVDRDAGRAWYWCADAGAVPIWEQGTPFLHVLHHWLSSRGMQLVHAGAAGTSVGGALFVGKSGSGKSTSTLACVRGGMRYAGDDYVVVAREPRPTVHALYSSGKLDAGNLAQFPELASRIENPDGPADEKRVFFVHDVAPELVATSFPLRAVLLPKVSGRAETSLAPATAAGALAALAPSTIFQMPGAAAQELAGIAAVLRAVPAHVLEAGRDLPRLARAVKDLVCDAPGEGPR